MKGLFLLAIVLTTLIACQRKLPSSSRFVSEDSNVSVVLTVPGSLAIPGCIQQKIDSIKKDRIWNPPAEVYEYDDNGKIVYAISADCCDRFTTVVDLHCRYVCAPSGGFTGRGDGKCPDFFKRSKQVRLVWKDERKRE